MQKTGIAQIALLALLPLFVVVFSQQFTLYAADTECHGMTSASSVPAGYGAPYDTLSSGKPLLLKVLCNPSISPRFTLGSGSSSQYIYHIGYHYAGGKWQQLRLAGPDKTHDPWYVGSAAVYIPASFPAGELQYVVGYICQRNGSAWKCGCRDAACTTPYWQMQTFVLPPGENQPLTMPNPLDLLKDHNELLLAYPSSPVASPGQSITLFGAAFSTTANTIHFGTIKVRGVAAESKNSIVVTVPSMTYGVTTIKVENEKGISNATFFVVKNPHIPAPTITSITPTSGNYGTEVTIRGTGFTGKNTITGLGALFEVSAIDATTIKFKIKPFPDIPELQTGNYNNQDLTIPFFPRIANENGIVAEPKQFLLKI